MDLSKLMGMFGFDPSAAEKLMQDEQMQEMMQDPELQQAMERPETEHLLGQLSGMFAQGGIMPDDVDNLLAGFGGGAEAGTSEQLDGLIAGEIRGTVNGVFRGTVDGEVNVRLLSGRAGPAEESGEKTKGEDRHE